MSTINNNSTAPKTFPLIWREGNGELNIQSTLYNENDSQVTDENSVLHISKQSLIKIIFDSIQFSKLEFLKIDDSVIHSRVLSIENGKSAIHVSIHNELSLTSRTNEYRNKFHLRCDDRNFESADFRLTSADESRNSGMAAKEFPKHNLGWVDITNSNNTMDSLIQYVPDRLAKHDYLIDEAAQLRICKGAALLLTSSQMDYASFEWIKLGEKQMGQASQQGITFSIAKRFPSSKQNSNFEIRINGATFHSTKIAIKDIPRKNRESAVSKATSPANSSAFFNEEGIDDLNNNNVFSKPKSNIVALIWNKNGSNEEIHSSVENISKNGKKIKYSGVVSDGKETYFSKQNNTTYHLRFDIPIEYLKTIFFKFNQTELDCMPSLDGINFSFDQRQPIPTSSQPLHLQVGNDLYQSAPVRLICRPKKIAQSAKRSSVDIPFTSDDSIQETTPSQQTKRSKSQTDLHNLAELCMNQDC